MDIIPILRWMNVLLINLAKFFSWLLITQAQVVELLLSFSDKAAK